MKVLQDAWYSRARWPLLLWPLEKLYLALAARDQKKKLQKQWQAPVPVIVVGNITVGGTGKSPLVAALVDYLKQKGWKPGVISRGYGGKSDHYPVLVTPETDTGVVGDEPVMLAGQTGVPVVVDPDRSRAARYLLSETSCDLIISDDGLQHLSLGRDLELVVIDGQRQLGNQHCLPVGPMREPASRLKTVDYIVVNGNGSPGKYFDKTPVQMSLKPLQWRQPVSGECLEIGQRPFHHSVRAIAGIGNPQRFFNTLEQLGLTVSGQSFPDHYYFSRDDVAANGSPVVMTAKDAVKCAAWLTEEHWVLDVSAAVDPVIMQDIHQKLLTIQKEKTNG
nr:tetraacyldisaccharide 4'-kinase [Oceanospirillum sediminis]